MISFRSDYNNGACREVLDMLMNTNDNVYPGYLTDELCAQATQKIKDFCKLQNAQVFYVMGGTQANALVTGTVLNAYEGVLAPETGHVSLHEGGAIEFAGHKVIGLPQKDGKLNVGTVKSYLETFYSDENHDKMVFPGMLYISHPTEYGTLYTKKELTELSEVCHSYNMKLYLDGARLAYGLSSHQTDVSCSDIARLCDVFYIGGTKCGSLCGEAIVFTKNNMPSHFDTIAKQRGAMTAKGRVLGAQFLALMTDNLYLKLGEHAIDMAEKIKALFISKGYKLFIDSPTNQQFVILQNSFMDSLKDKVEFEFWEKYDSGSTVVRFASSWATKQSDIDYLASLV